jgi:hypothetical protein
MEKLTVFVMLLAALVLAQGAEAQDSLNVTRVG